MSTKNLFRRLTYTAYSRYPISIPLLGQTAYTSSDNAFLVLFYQLCSHSGVVGQPPMFSVKPISILTCCEIFLERAVYFIKCMGNSQVAIVCPWSLEPVNLPLTVALRDGWFLLSWSGQLTIGWYCSAALFICWVGGRGGCTKPILISRVLCRISVKAAWCPCDQIGGMVSVLPRLLIIAAEEFSTVKGCKNGLSTAPVTWLPFIGS